MLATIVILVVAAAFFVSGRIRSDLVALCAALALVLTGVLTPEEALTGFSNTTVLMMAGLFIVGGGILATGLAKTVGSKIVTAAGGNETKLMVLVVLATCLIGAFVSNTGTVALMMPIVVGMAQVAGLHQSRLLMPLAFAGSMGGMLTLIGTPPNLIISNTLEEAGYGSLSFFVFTPVGIVIIVVGVLALIPLTRLFLSDRGSNKETARGKTMKQLTEEYHLAEDVTVLQVEDASSPVVGKTVRELDLRSRYALNVLEIRREQGKTKLLARIEQFAVGKTPLEAGDKLYVSGARSDAEEFALKGGLLVLQNEVTSQDFRFYDVGMAEVLLLNSSPLLGNTVAETDFRTKYRLNVLGIKRKTEYLLKDIKEIRLHEGDILLVQGSWERIGSLAGETSQWVVMGQPWEQAAKVALDYKAPLAAVIMLLMVVAMTAEWVAPVTAVGLAAVLMVATGCVRGMEGAYKSINWESIVLFAAMMPMSTALGKTGTDSLIADNLVNFFGGYGNYVLLASLYVATSFMTFFISNTVTAMLMAPIALKAAEAAGISPFAFLFAVTVAASMCFASPFSTPPNALVLSAGGYKPIDYIKVGLPLQIIIAIVMVVALPIIFPFN